MTEPVNRIRPNSQCYILITLLHFSPFFLEPSDYPLIQQTLYDNKEGWIIHTPYLRHFSFFSFCDLAFHFKCISYLENIAKIEFPAFSHSNILQNYSTVIKPKKLTLIQYNWLIYRPYRDCNNCPTDVLSWTISQYLSVISSQSLPIWDNSSLFLRFP